MINFFTEIFTNWNENVIFKGPLFSNKIPFYHFDHSISTNLNLIANLVCIKLGFIKFEVN